MRIVERIRIERPPAQVWSVVSDLDTHLEWRPALVEFRQVSDGPLAGGSLIREVLKWRGRELGLDDVLTHTLINDGMWAVELAPWAITQFRLGGTVVLPMPVGSVDDAGLLPNRQFSLWPYAHINDPRVQWGDEFVLFKADALLPPFKLGYFNPHGWMAYWLEAILFRKTFDAYTNAAYPDNNCNAEIYCNDCFVELESLGLLTKLGPGTFIHHVEKWDASNGMDSLPKDAQRLLGSSKSLSA